MTEHRTSSLIIAIDGPAAAGKGTLARRIAQDYHFAYLDTGSLYRGVAWCLLSRGVDPENKQQAEECARNFCLDDIEGADIRTRTVGAAASIVAANDGVRAALLDFQRNFAQHPPQNASLRRASASSNMPVKGVVLDGRDIGTVVCPEAPLKLFVTASARTRAHRRWLELVSHNPSLKESDIFADIEARDARDAGRASAPLTQAEDAHLIDTTHLSIDAAFAAVQPLIDALMMR